MINSIMEKYPNNFKLVKETKQNYPIKWGFECNSGWDELIEETLKKIFAIDPNCQIGQVKEKLGTLRIWVVDAIDNKKDIWNIVLDAEKQSHYICEDCGKKFNDPLTKTINGWIYASCDDCLKKANIL